MDPNPTRSAAPARERVISDAVRTAGDRLGRAVREARAWRIAFFLSFAALCAAAATLGYLALYPRHELYIAAVDRLGVQAPLERASRARRNDPAIVASELNRWIVNIRSVSSDPHAQERMVRQAYAYVGPEAGKVLNSYFREPANDPRLIAARGVRLIDVRMAQPLNAASPTWVVMWDEQLVQPSSSPAERSTWQAYLTVKQVDYPKRTDRRGEEQQRLNPFGIFIMELSWSRISNPSGLLRETP